MVQARPPIVVILGHVDHGKTSLLDALRKSNIAAREVGGITQSTRSFQVTTTDNKLITFIDTPGHAAFKDMRSRGGKIADIAILVVAANDGVMPQTKESIEAIKSAGISTIVAINKIDLPEASIDRVKAQLAENGVVVEDYGGDTPVVPVSAKSGQGLSDLLDMINLVTDLNPPQADPEGELEAIVLEASLDPKKGPVATLIIKNGTLKEGQTLPLGKVKALTSTTGEKMTSASLSTPVQILGLNSVPAVGSVITPNAVVTKPVVNQSQTKEAPIQLILKTDVAGSLEAILASLSPEVGILYSGTGDITESDVLTSLSTKGIIVGFNVKVPASVAKLAETEKVKVRTYPIIYELLDAVEKLLHPDATETITGRANIVAEFPYEKLRVAGCKCTEGEFKKNDLLRLMRGDQVMGETRFKSLRFAKTEVTLVKTGAEFGAIFGPQLDFQVGDAIIAVNIHG